MHCPFRASGSAMRHDIFSLKNGSGSTGGSRNVRNAIAKEALSTPELRIKTQTTIIQRA